MKHLLWQFLLPLALLLLPLASSGQSLTGMTGLLNAPSGEFQEDGTFFLGASYLSKGFSHYGENEYDLLAYYANITILPFVEIGFRSTGRLREPGPFHVDRMPSIRLRVLPEKKYLPGLVAGVHDLLTSATSGNQHFGATYLAAVKHFPVAGFELGLHGGYGFEILRNSQFAGPFGGISISHSKLPFLTLAGEYDSQNINLGAKALIFNHLQLMVVWQGMRAFSGSVVYKVYLQKAKE